LAKPAADRVFEAMIGDRAWRALYLEFPAHAARDDAPVPVRVLAGIADALPWPDDSVDAAVASLVLCSVTDQTARSRSSVV
jgi:Methyltransferase domain